MQILLYLRCHINTKGKKPNTKPNKGNQRAKATNLFGFLVVQNSALVKSFRTKRGREREREPEESGQRKMDFHPYCTTYFFLRQVVMKADFGLN